MIDFTHRIVERDYMFQTCVEGQRWSDIEEELTPNENAKLWQQCGKIVKCIHETPGEQFGYPYPSRQFTSWSEMILGRFARIYESMLAQQLEATVFKTISDIVRAHASILDEISTPHLLHGDLWTFNLLVARSHDQPTIIGVLDADRAWWGDPMADWIMFLLAIRRDEPEWQPWLSAFYDGYGIPASGPAAHFRQEVYKTMHIGSAAVGALRNGDGKTVARARRDLHEIAQELSLLQL